MRKENVTIKTIFNKILIFDRENPVSGIIFKRNYLYEVQGGEYRI